MYSGSQGYSAKNQTPYVKLGPTHICTNWSTTASLIHIRDAHHFSSALNLFKLGQAWHMPRFKTITLNLTFQSHASYPSNQALNTKQAWGTGSAAPCSIHPTPFDRMLCRVIQIRVWLTRLFPPPAALQGARVILVTLSVVFLSKHFLLNRELHW